MFQGNGGSRCDQVSQVIAPQPMPIQDFDSKNDSFWHPPMRSVEFHVPASVPGYALPELPSPYGRITVTRKCAKSASA